MAVSDRPPREVDYETVARNVLSMSLEVQHDDTLRYALQDIIQAVENGEDPSEPYMDMLVEFQGYQDYFEKPLLLMGGHPDVLVSGYNRAKAVTPQIRNSGYVVGKYQDPETDIDIETVHGSIAMTRRTLESILEWLDEIEPSEDGDDNA